nr:hypothetical protein [uncultured Campylobacter sp.]
MIQIKALGLLVLDKISNFGALGFCSRAEIYRYRRLARTANKIKFVVRFFT